MLKQVFLIDSLTIVGQMRSKPALEKFFNRLSDISMAKIWITPTNINYHDNILLQDGTLLQIAHMKGRNKNLLDLRLDLNIQKCNRKTISELLTHFRDIEFTRIDTAIDYYGTDINTLYLQNEGVARKQTRIYGDTGRLETHYLGSRESDLQFRMYDKALEQKRERQTWTRIELQKRIPAKNSEERKGYLNTEAWQTIGLYEMPKFKNLTDEPTRTAIWRFYAEHPSMLGKLTWTQRGRVKIKFKEENRLYKPQPIEIVEFLKPQIQADLNELKKCDGHFGELPFRYEYRREVS